MAPLERGKPTIRANPCSEDAIIIKKFINNIAIINCTPDKDTWLDIHILPMLPYPGSHSSGDCTLVVLELTYMVVKWRRCLHVVKLTSLCGIVSQRVQGLLKAYFKIKAKDEQEKSPLFA